MPDGHQHHPASPDRVQRNRHCNAERRGDGGTGVVNWSGGSSPWRRSGPTTPATVSRCGRELRKWRGALPQQNRYPTQVVASNKILPESRIYVMYLARTNSGIRRWKYGYWNRGHRCVAGSLSDGGGQLYHVPCLGSPGGNREPAGRIVVWHMCYPVQHVLDAAASMASSATFRGILLRAVSGCWYNNGGLRNRRWANAITKHGGKGEWQTCVQTLPFCPIELRGNRTLLWLCDHIPTQRLICSQSYSRASQPREPAKSSQSHRTSMRIFWLPMGTRCCSNSVGRGKYRPSNNCRIDLSITTAPWERAPVPASTIKSSSTVSI